MDEPHSTVEYWQALTTQLQRQRAADLAVFDSLKAENATLRQHNDQLTAQNAQLSEQVSKLTLLLEEQRRAGKRQAAPFSKGPPNPNPKRPGRKSGENYGKHHRRETPQKIDETHAAPLPTACPHCGGHEWVDETLQYQYQVEIPREVIHRRFEIECGKCCRCGERTQGRHPLQTSDAVGAAAVQLGPNLHAAATVLNKELGLPHGKVRRAFQRARQIWLAPFG